MSLRRYKEYKRSDSPWLATVPVHWEPSRLKRIVAYIESGVSVNAVDEPARPNSLGVLKTSCVYTGIFDPNENKAVLPDEIGRVACHVKADTLIVSRMNTPSLVGAAGLVTETLENLFLPDRLWQVHFVNAEPKFVYYWTNSASYRAQVQMACAGTSASMQNLSQDEFLRFVLPLPPRLEQTAIAAFLDRETAKIDALIAEQEKLIALLAEKRQAANSYAVTKGLNPNVSMRESGVAWLGEVPAHWRIMSLKHLVSVPISDGPHETPNFPDEGIPFVSAEAVSGGFINFGKIRGYISEEDHQRYSEKYKPQLHDIYMVKSGATTGVTAIVEAAMEFNIWSPLAAIRCDKQKADPYFVLAALRSRNFQEGVALNWSFGTQQNIGMGVLGDLPIALPPLEEQSEIAAYLALQIPKLSTLSAEAERTIALLKERRSALIAAAVTGQIDVRGTTSKIAAQRPEAIAA